MTLSNHSILVTGANGFIGKNLIVRLNELANISVITFLRSDEVALLPQLLSQQVDSIVHLAGENRPADEFGFEQVNIGLTSALCDAIKQVFRCTGRHIPLVFASSTQVERDNLYGKSKLAAEAVVEGLSKETGNPCVIFRLPGVFGKWCKPNYNSVVATFCYNIARNLPIKINDPSASLRLVYVDNVVTALLAALERPVSGCVQAKLEPEYVTTLGELANKILTYSGCRSTLMIERVGVGFERALYATYVSYLPKETFSYKVAQHSDPRGVFVEMLKTPDTGQFSYFTVNLGVTRGGHYHHTKTEKFLVIKGKALFRFRNIITGERHEFYINDEKAEIVETVPGWAHDITNVGDEVMIVMLWANEIFDRQCPDTIAAGLWR
jgi:UDP-2-acetamido-2,6-beta-L-arabino-hexul-4-ose reductase